MLFVELQETQLMTPQLLTHSMTARAELKVCPLGQAQTGGLAVVAVVPLGQRQVLLTRLKLE